MENSSVSLILIARALLLIMTPLLTIQRTVVFNCTLLCTQL
jgi:hypothetical protein